MSLTQHIGQFSATLRGFSEHVTGSVDELRRCANARASNGRARPSPLKKGVAGVAWTVEISGAI